MPKSQTVIISGMHRSGTSLVTSILQSCGIHIGDRLLGGNQSNPFGHYEDMDFLEFHQSALGESNKEGYAVGVVPEIDQAHQQLAKQIIASKKEHDLWGWKDPRTILFLEFWRSQLTSSKTMLVYRHPMEVMISLIKRGTDWEIINNPSKAIELWSFYNKQVLEYKQKHPDECVLCNLSGITSNIDAFINLATKQLKLPLKPVDTSTHFKKDELNQFHWPASTNEFLDIFSHESLELYNALEAVSDLAGDTDKLPTLDLPWASFKDLALNVGDDVKATGSSLCYLLTNIIDPSLNKKFFHTNNLIIDAQTTELKTRKEFITQQQQSIIERDTSLHNVSVELNIHKKALDSKEAKLKQYQDELQTQNQTNIKLQDKLDKLEGKCKEQQADIEQRSAELKDIINEQQKVIEARDTALSNYKQELHFETSQSHKDQRQLILARTRLIAIEDSIAFKFCYRLSTKTRQIAALGRKLLGGFTSHPLFNESWYQSNYPNSRAIARFPYVHYKLFGWREGRNPNPYFDVAWYLQQYPDILKANIDPLIHYSQTGWKEGRDPSDKFSTSSYLERHPQLLDQNINPLGHFISNPVEHEPKNTETPATKNFPPLRSPDAEREQSNYNDTSVKLPDSYEDETKPHFQKLPARLIAFYLPQFHPIPENNLFWGEGFTEWRNVTKAKPQFDGHFQPQLPGSLGFYDLRIPEVMQRQAELARQYGISGFCFHFYWFNGRRVLERPVEQLLKDQSIEIEFCLNWANENWTRSWDGKEKEVLIEQNHTPEDDINFIKEAQRFFDDPRYIRVDDKPLLMVYNPTLLPDAAATAKRWRDHCQQAGFEIFLLVAETHGFDSQNESWFDGLVEFPPLRRLPDNVTHHYNLLTDFKGNIFNYEDLIRIHSKPQQSEFPIFKTVSPGWDNTARRDEKATIFAGATPQLYKEWLSSAIEQTVQNNDDKQRLIFINAWNEWAEGAYLEPNAQSGYAYLNATAKALKEFDANEPTLLFTTHDTNLGGAQNLLLTLLRWLKAHTRLKIRILALSGGVLESQFEELFPTYIIGKTTAESDQKTKAEVLHFCGENIRLVFMNTVVSTALLPYLKPIKAPRLLYVHELKNSIEKFYGDKKFAKATPEIDAFIGGSQPVVDNLIASYGIPENKTSVLESFIVSSNPDTSGSYQETFIARQALKTQLGFDESTTLIIGCGMIEWRKGPDLFADVARQIKQNGTKAVKFIWIGPLPQDTSELDNYLNGVEDIVEFVGEKTNFKAYFDMADIFLLPSREDPFPLVCLEAADSRLPIITFADNGGSPKFIANSDCGYIVPFEDTTAMTQKLQLLLEDQELCYTFGNNGHQAVLSAHSDQSAGPRIIETIRTISQIKPKVSIIVPAYNHSNYLRKRLNSIYSQTFQDFEVILLNDASTDDTQVIFEEYQHHANTRVYANDVNSESPFKQWSKGIHLAKSDIIWIAEDDDCCEDNFLEEMLPLLNDPEVKLAYCQSFAIDETGKTQFSYMDYYQHEFDTFRRWQDPFQTSGDTEINQGLGLINTIPNASAVLFRKFDIEAWEKKWLNSKLAGDWAFYIHALHDGQVAFNPKHINYHRRHPQTMTQKTKNADTRFKEVAEVHKDVLDLYQVDDSTKNAMESKMKEVWLEVSKNTSNKDFRTAYNKIITP
ncbi:MAG: glycoside hydrolase family 99-like domain-containing protein [Arenicella sp.]